MAEKILELRAAGYTWNAIDVLIIPTEKLKYSKNGKIYSQAWVYAQKHMPWMFNPKPLAAKIAAPSSMEMFI
jgi:hypothetical protein